MVKTALLAIGLLETAAAWAGGLVLTPGHLGEYTWVEEPTAAKSLALAEKGKLPFVEVKGIADYRPALVDYGPSAAAVAFEQVPPVHLLHSWKSLGVKVLKTVRYDREGTPARFRREAGLLAFSQGADGVWIPNAKEMPPEWVKALKASQDDRKVFDYVSSLADKARAKVRSDVWIEHRRVGYYFGWMNANREDPDVARLDCIGWARRLEQLLKLPEAKLPFAVADVPAAPAGAFKPFDDLPVLPPQVKLGGANERMALGEGLYFTYGTTGFSLSFVVSNQADLVQWAMPGRRLDFRLYVSDPKKPGAYLPYRFHCDLDPEVIGPQAGGRFGWAFSSDWRFRPGGFGYAHSMPRLWTLPQPREYGTDYPDPHGSFAMSTDKKTGALTATVSFDWLSFFGYWPGETEGRTDVWFVGLDRTPTSNRPLVRRLVWPRAKPALHVQRLQALTSSLVGGRCAAERARTDVWNESAWNKAYPFAKTDRPCYHCGDLESDQMFMTRVVKPLLDEGGEALATLYPPKKDATPKFDELPPERRLKVLEFLPAWLSLSHRVDRLRCDYLLGRAAGKVPPEPPKKKAQEGKSRDELLEADVGGDVIELDDKEF